VAMEKKEFMSEILRLLSERRELLAHSPHSCEQLEKDKEISARILELVDQICGLQSVEGIRVA